jgi:hypothetical protein
LSGGVSKWEVVVKVMDNFNCRFVKVGRDLSGGVSGWEVVVKMADNFKWWCVKMGSGSQSGEEF